MRATGEVIAEAFRGWSAHKAARMGGALSYMTAFSVGPLIVLGIAIGGLVFGPDAAAGRVFEQLRGVVGDDAAEGVQTVARGASHVGTSTVAIVLGGLSLLLGACGVFGELHGALNTVWGVRRKAKQPLRTLLRDRFFSLAMVMSTGFLLLVSLLVSSVLTIVGGWLSSTLPGGETVWEVLNTLISLVVVGGIFTLIFKLVPDVKLGWRPAAIAGGVTAVLFALGKIALAAYIAHEQLRSTYGAAGSLVVLLVWVYYAAQILYFGAELSRAIAERAGGARPARSASKVLTDAPLLRRRRTA